MIALSAPMFFNLNAAREWVKAQTLSETFLLVEHNASKELKDSLRAKVGDVPDNVYEFFNFSEWADFQAEENHSPFQRTSRLVEQWK